MANVSSAIAPQAKAASSVKEVTTASFRADVLTASTRRPVLVDFWAPWCGPCKQLAPALEKAVANSNGKVTLVKMNIDEHPQIAGQLGIQSIPAVIAFDKGQAVDGFVGALPESQIRGFIERLVGPLEGGSAALAGGGGRGRRQRRCRRRGGALRRNPGRRPGRRESPRGSRQASGRRGAAQGGESAFGDGPARRRRARSRSRRSPPPGRRCDWPNRPRTSASSLLSSKPSRPTRMITKRASILPSRSRRREIGRARPISCIEIIRRDRKWNDEAARKQLLQLFEAWGLMDPASVAARRKLSAIWF